MKKLSVFILIFGLILILTGCEEKKVVNIIPEGEYDFIERISTDGTTLTRDDLEEKDIYTDGIIINIWANNKATIGKVTASNEIQKFEVSVTDEYFTGENDDKLKYKYSNNKIELYYENGVKEVYTKDYRKRLEERYQEMIGHYEIVSWVNGDGIDVIINNDASIIAKLKENTYLDVSNNKKASVSLYTNMGGSTFHKYDYLRRIDNEHFYSSEEKTNYVYNNGKITLYMYDDGETATMLFQKTK